MIKYHFTCPIIIFLMKIASADAAAAGLAFYSLWTAVGPHMSGGVFRVDVSLDPTLPFLRVILVAAAIH